MGGGNIIAEGSLSPGSIYTIGSDATDHRLAMFLLQTQMNRGSGRTILLGNLSSKMKEAIKTADAYLKANLKNLGIDHDLKAYDFTVSSRAFDLNRTAIPFKSRWNHPIIRNGVYQAFRLPSMPYQIFARDSHLLPFVPCAE
jgi:hypothetical protein